jgi:hypothetical protein
MPDLYGIIVNPSTVVGGSNVSVVVMLTSAAPSSGATVSLAGTNPAFPSAQVTIPGGMTQQTFSLPTNPVSGTTAVTVVGSYTAVQKSADLTIMPGGSASITSGPKVAWASAYPLSLSGGGSTSFYVFLSSPAPAGGLTINLTTSNATAVAPMTVTISGGNIGGVWTVPTNSVQAQTNVTLTAAYNGGVGSVGITLTP